VVTFYKFVDLNRLDELRSELEAQATRLDIVGTVLLAPEGINGTLSGAADALQTLVVWLRDQSEFSDLVVKYSAADSDNPVFRRLKIRIKPEIVNMGRPHVPVAKRTGTHVGPEAWHALLEDPDVVVIDTRNDYEIEIGTFPGAVNPNTGSFREFPEYVARNLDPRKNKRVAMFCTGGVRCEKASSYMLDQGFEEVFQLDGGILSYLENVSSEDNHWRGECFVFDQRVSVDESLRQGSFVQCFACRRALTEADTRSADYREGVSCPHCIAETDEQRRAGFAERARQEGLALARGDRHIGKTMPAAKSG
jgi:UPF0176 protein